MYKNRALLGARQLWYRGAEPAPTLAKKRWRAFILVPPEPGQQGDLDSAEDESVEAVWKLRGSYDDASRARYPKADRPPPARKLVIGAMRLICVALSVRLPPCVCVCSQLYLITRCGDGAVGGIRIRF